VLSRIRSTVHCVIPEYDEIKPKWMVRFVGPHVGAD
jgi:hypothetical protein